MKRICSSIFAMSKFISASIIISTLFCLSGAHAADISGDVLAVSDGAENNDGGYFEFGVNLNLNTTGERAFLDTTSFLAGAYRYRRLFFEAFDPLNSLNDESIGAISLGVNIWRNSRWSIDVLGANARWRLSRQRLSIDLENSTDPLLEKKLLNRRTFYNGSGIRVTGQFGNALFQYRLVNDIHGGNGLTSSARIGYSRQVKNWNYHGVVSANYVSQKTGQFWYGVSDDEASERFPQYDVGVSTVSYSGELGASLPVRENVVFRSTARYTQLAQAIAKSPLQEGEYEFSWNNSISYVF